MTTYVKMSLEEFDELKEQQNKPSVLIQGTINNLTNKLSIANARIQDLEKENSMYAIGGAKKREVKQEYKLPIVRGKAWTPTEELRLKTAVQHKHTLAQLSNEIGRTEAAIATKARSLGYKIKDKLIVKMV